jgi:hypothetical protein
LAGTKLALSSQYDEIPPQFIDYHMNLYSRLMHVVIYYDLDGAILKNAGVRSKVKNNA